MDLKFEFSFETKQNNSFRSKSLIGQYDLENKTVIQKFSGDYKLPENWNVGLIVGNSGSGKTSIAKNVFGEFKKLNWNQNSIIDNFKDDLTMEQITDILGSVGFNSVPYWLKPFNVLSNGEKQRVELARLASENELVVFDEFSSLVDRDVAKSMSNSVQKLFRKLNKKIVCVTCHKDLNEWLLPDWVYDTDEKVFFLPEKTRIEKLTFNIQRVTNKQWEYFKKYHYLNESLPAAHYYMISLNNKKVGFISINRFPHPIAKDIMVISRLVIVPEFQGFGIGLKFMNEVANFYKQDRIRITTSLKPFIVSLKKQKNWKCVRFSRVGSGSGSGSIHSKNNKKSFSCNRITATFELIK